MKVNKLLNFIVPTNRLRLNNESKQVLKMLLATAQPLTQARNNPEGRRRVNAQEGSVDGDRAYEFLSRARRAGRKQPPLQRQRTAAPKK